MLIYKFGGASVNSADGVRNLCSIVRRVRAEKLLVVVSAMGKTTNAMEDVLGKMLAGDKAGALDRFSLVEEYHNGIISDLAYGKPSDKICELYGQIRDLIAAWKPSEPAASNSATSVLNGVTAKQQSDDYDRAYDSLVGYGELLSTAIISDYMASAGIPNRWLDMRNCLVTDAHHRSANVLPEESAPRLSEAMGGGPEVFIGQGFIGGTKDGIPTTLGREGSDYSAAVVANLLDAREVVIWKDVPGILNADPRLFPDTVLIPELTYLDAIELAYSGAQIIHPKTIKPLQNKNIPLCVRPFADPSAKGSVIKGDMKGRIEIPILILKPNQVLISIRPRDFSFVLADRLTDIMLLLDSNDIKINLIQTSAVNLSICVDTNRNLDRVVEELQKDCRVVYNDGMELLTIRGYTPELYHTHAEANDVFLSQKTRRIVRLVRKSLAKS